MEIMSDRKGYKSCEQSFNQKQEFSEERKEGEEEEEVQDKFNKSQI